MPGPRDEVAAVDLRRQAESPVGHEFEHGADAGRHGQRRALGWALGLNGALLVVEVAGGIVFGSLALLADAAHLVSDGTGLAIALGALILTARPVSIRHSFGFARAEVLAAQVSALLLVAAGGWILFESVNRLRDPVPVDGAGLAAVATVGLAVNLGSALLVHRAQGESLNMRASFVHLATDAAGSLGAVVAGLLILGWGWLRADSVVSMATAVLVLWAGWGLLSDTTHVLMEGTPRGMDAERVRAAMLEVGGVAEFHHLHLFLWNLRRHPDGVRRSRLTPRRVGRRVAAGSSPPHEPPACARRRDAAPLADLGRVLALVAFAVLSWTPALRQMPPAPHRPTTPRGWCRRGRRRR